VYYEYSYHNLHFYARPSADKKSTRESAATAKKGRKLSSLCAAAAQFALAGAKREEISISACGTKSERKESIAEIRRREKSTKGLRRTFLITPGASKWKIGKAAALSVS